MDNNDFSSLPDPLTVAFPNLAERLAATGDMPVDIFTFRTTPGSADITEFIIVDTETDTTIGHVTRPGTPYDMTGEIVFDCPSLVREIPEGERTYEEISFSSDDVPAYDVMDDVVDESDADAITEIIELDEAIAAPAIAEHERLPKLPRRYRGKRRAPRKQSALLWALLIGGLALLVYGVGVQLYLAPTHPLMAGLSIPALVMAGAALMGALSEKR